MYENRGICENPVCSSNTVRAAGVP
jgi:hypothetical protein